MKIDRPSAQARYSFFGDSLRLRHLGSEHNATPILPSCDLGGLWAGLGGPPQWTPLRPSMTIPSVEVAQAAL